MTPKLSQRSNDAGHRQEITDRTEKARHHVVARPEVEIRHIGLEKLSGWHFSRGDRQERGIDVQPVRDESASAQVHNMLARSAAELQYPLRRPEDVCQP